jgi:hypothetical protein
MAYLPQEEICPISEQLLFSLYDAAKRGLPVPVPKCRRKAHHRSLCSAIVEATLKRRLWQ